MKKFYLPKLGMRTVKTGICVFVCIMLYYLSNGIVGLYPCIVAIVCLQNSIENSWQTARSRVIGTAMGGFFGIIILYMLGSPISSNFNLMLLISIPIALIILIYLCNIIKIHSSITIASIVFVSIFINTNINMEPYLFALTRIMDTLIGVGVAMLINVYVIPAKSKEKQQINVECSNFEMILMQVHQEFQGDEALILYDSYLTQCGGKRVKKPYANVGVSISLPVIYVKEEEVTAAYIERDYSLHFFKLKNINGYVEIPPETMPCTIIWQQKN